jgi:hypothetical protein
MSALRLASWAVLLTAALDVGASIATQFLGLRIESEVGRGVASLLMGGLLAGLGWLSIRGNKLALILAIGLSLFDIMAGVCLSTSTGIHGGIGGAARAVLVALMIASVAAILGPSKKPPLATIGREKPPKESHLRVPEAITTEPGAVNRTNPPVAAPDTKGRDPVRRRFRRAIAGLFVLLGCGVAFMLWEMFFQCDPRHPWDMQLGCVIRADPTPRPFPLEGVRQLTFDATYYEQLRWSPAGGYLLAIRCEMIQRQAACYEGRQPVLIDLATGQVSDLDFSWYPTAATSLELDSYIWSSDGNEVLLDFTEVFVATPVPPEPPSFLSDREYVRHQVVLNLATQEYTEIETGGVWPIAWLDGQSTIFGYQRGKYNQEAGNSIDSFGWYDYQAQSWQEEMKLNSDNYGRTLTLSPDQMTVLLGRDLSNSSCHGQVLVYELGNHAGGFTDIRGACFPAYSVDGSKLAFSRIAEGEIWPHGVWIAGTDGSNPQPAFVVDEPESTSSIAWSPDGSEIAFTYGYHFNAIYVIEVPEHLRP